MRMNFFITIATNIFFSPLAFIQLVGWKQFEPIRINWMLPSVQSSDQTRIFHRDKRLVNLSKTFLHSSRTIKLNHSIKMVDKLFEIFSSWSKPNNYTVRKQVELTSMTRVHKREREAVTPQCKSRLLLKISFFFLTWNDLFKHKQWRLLIDFLVLLSLQSKW